MTLLDRIAPLVADDPLDDVTLALVRAQIRAARNRPSPHGLVRSDTTAAFTAGLAQREGKAGLGSHSVGGSDVLA